MSSKKPEEPKVHPETPLEEKIAEGFNRFDHSGKQLVEVKEVKTLLRSMGCCPTEAEVEQIVTATAVKEDPEFISLYRFMPFMVKAINENKFRPATPDDLLAAFKYFDKENRGFLTKEQFTSIMFEQGEIFDIEEEYDEIMNLALDPVTGHIPYEYYINQLCVAPLDLYRVAEEMEAERLRLEALKPKKRLLV